jgi:hypothetical protein
MVMVARAQGIYRENIRKIPVGIFRYSRDRIEVNQIPVSINGNTGKAIFVRSAQIRLCHAKLRSICSNNPAASLINQSRQFIQFLGNRQRQCNSWIAICRYSWSMVVVTTLLSMMALDDFTEGDWRFMRVACDGGQSW